VCTDVGGVADLVGDAAVVVPPGDPVALRAAVDAVLADRATAERLRTAGRQRASTWPTVDNTVDTVENLYLDLYARVRPQAQKPGRGDHDAPGDTAG
jgi:glycosyltransferase involved in cell wall biosynthesis